MPSSDTFAVGTTCPHGANRKPEPFSPELQVAEPELCEPTPTEPDNDSTPLWFSLWFKTFGCAVMLADAHLSLQLFPLLPGIDLASWDQARAPRSCTSLFSASSSCRWFQGGKSCCQNC
jgi:hypothetical protein